MNKTLKTITSYRADIASFEKEQPGNFFKYQVKEYNPAGLLLRETEYKPNGAPDIETKYEYDLKGNLIAKETYYSLEDSYEKMKHTYDENGRKLTDESFFGDDIFETVVYKTDDKGHVLSVIRLDEDGNETEKQVNEYDENGRLAKQDNHAEGEPDKTILFTYDSEGKLIKETHLTGNKTDETIQYIYNEAGKKANTATFDSEGTPIGYVDTEYDEHQNPIKSTSETSGFYSSKATSETVYDEQGRVLDSEYFDVFNNFLMSKEKYEYDENGNVATQEIFETNPMAGLKKTHYRLRHEYDFYAD